MVTAEGATGAASQLAGRRVLVAASGMGLGRELARGLTRHGARVVEIAAAFTSRAQAHELMADAANELGGADLIVHASATAQALAQAPLEALAPADWQAAVHQSMLATLFCLQAAHARQRDGGGTVVVVGPSTTLVGAANQVPLMTLAEAQRTLVKSAARQWGGLGMRLNWVGVAPGQYDCVLAQAAWPPTPELGPPPPALRRVPQAQADVADVIAWLGSDGARAVTGASFNLDGGDWMVP
ncbi:MAG TPA: SDR family oxidoreductase [Ramlibacter sp.]|nr:SDR family oxidoreductase [Ramlibacter sp.]